MFISKPAANEKTPALVEAAQKAIINEVQDNAILRECIISDSLCKNRADIWDFIRNYLPANYKYTFEICDKPTCISTEPPLDKAIYTTDVLISSSMEQQNTRIFRIWIWEQDVT
jgi:hypothetical protein